MLGKLFLSAPQTLFIAGIRIQVSVLEEERKEEKWLPRLSSYLNLKSCKHLFRLLCFVFRVKTQIKCEWLQTGLYYH